MLTIQKMKKECPIIDGDMPSMPNFFKDCASVINLAFRQQTEVWDTKLYHVFATNLGCVFEQIMFEIAYYSKMCLFIELKIECELKKEGDFYSKERNQGNTLSNFSSYILNYSNKSKQIIINKKVSIIESFGIMCNLAFDTDTKLVFIDLFKKVLIFRNQYTHGNINLFMKNYFPNLLMEKPTKFNVSDYPNFEMPETKILIKSYEFNELFLLQALYPPNIGINSYFKNELIRLHTEFSFMLNYLYEFMQSNEFKNKIKSL